MSTSVRLGFLELMLGVEAGEERLAADGQSWRKMSIVLGECLQRFPDPRWLGPLRVPASASNTKVTLLYQVL